MKCVNCGTEIPDNSKFCIECGATQPVQEVESNNDSIINVERAHCKFCGAEIEEDQPVCFSCGATLDVLPKQSPVVPVNNDSNVPLTICKSCGKPIAADATVCMECGAAQNNYSAFNPTVNPSAKSKALAAILAFLFGAIGIHDFYLGYTKNGVLKIVLSIFTLGAVGSIWGFVDFIRILTGSISCDAQGNPLS